MILGISAMGLYKLDFHHLNVQQYVSVGLLIVFLVLLIVKVNQK